MTRSSSRRERRGPDRPKPGDWKACSSCAQGMLVFTEAFQRVGPQRQSTAVAPAWVCDRCPHVLLVRAEDQRAAVRPAPKEVRARAQRHLMKARFVRGRAQRALRKSRDKKRREE